jgi:hypothetical protein
MYRMLYIPAPYDTERPVQIALYNSAGSSEGPVRRERRNVCCGSAVMMLVMGPPRVTALLNSFSHTPHLRGLRLSLSGWASYMRPNCMTYLTSRSGGKFRVSNCKQIDTDMNKQMDSLCPRYNLASCVQNCHRFVDYSVSDGRSHCYRRLHFRTRPWQVVSGSSCKILR